VKRHDDAERHLLRARKILDDRDLGDNSLSALVDETLAQLAVARGRTADARASSRAPSPPPRPTSARTTTAPPSYRVAIAELLLDQHQPEPAAAHLARAREILKDAPDADPAIAKLRAQEARLPGNSPRPPASQPPRAPLPP
jgi:hypothetical protein